LIALLDFCRLAYNRGQINATFTCERRARYLSGTTDRANTYMQGAQPRNNYLYEFFIRLPILPSLSPKTHGANLPSPMPDHSLSAQTIEAIIFMFFVPVQPPLQSSAASHFASARL
jgi:hypothetical protein